jgi:hypothetical protein
MATPPDIRSPENWALYREQASNATNAINHMPFINSSYNPDSTLIGNAPANTAANEAAAAAALAAQQAAQQPAAPGMRHYSQVDFTGNTYNPQTGKWSISDAPDIDWSTFAEQPASPAQTILAPDSALMGDPPPANDFMLPEQSAPPANDFIQWPEPPSPGAPPASDFIMGAPPPTGAPSSPLQPWGPEPWLMSPTASILGVNR